ncbi:MAG: M23 family metallopeptidase [Alphaproteobacteria bacterium]
MSWQVIRQQSELEVCRLAFRLTHKLGLKSSVARASMTIAVWTAVSGGIAVWQNVATPTDQSRQIVEKQFTTEQAQAQAIARAIDLDQRASTIADQKRRLDLLVSEDPAAPPILERHMILQMLGQASDSGYTGYASIGGPLIAEQSTVTPRPHWLPAADQLAAGSSVMEAGPTDLTQQAMLDQDIEQIEALFGPVTTANKTGAKQAMSWQFDRNVDIAGNLDQVEANQADALIWLHEVIETAIKARRAILAKTGLSKEAVFADASGLDNSPVGENVNTRQVGGPLLDAATDTAPMNSTVLAAEPVRNWNAGTALADNEKALAELAALNDILMALPIRFPTVENRVWTSSHYGYRRDAFTKHRAFHSGMDFAGQRGVPVKATAEGIVVHAGPKGAYGNLVAISHGYGLKTRYAHLSRVDVKVGDLVAVGTPLGAIGTTGRSTGNHLHYEVWYGRNSRDPRPFIDAGRDLAALVKGEATVAAK